MLGRSPLDWDLERDDGAVKLSAASQAVLHLQRTPTINAKVSESAARLLFAEICLRTKCKDFAEWEARLASLGHAHGIHSLELALIREHPRGSETKETGLETMLAYVVSQLLWKRWFGHAVGVSHAPVEQSYRLTEEDSFLMKFAQTNGEEFVEYSHPDFDPKNPATDPFSVPFSVKERPPWRKIPLITVAAYVSGMIQGALEAGGFPCKVSAYGGDANDPEEASRTVFEVMFEPEVMDRERQRQVALMLKKGK